MKPVLVLLPVLSLTWLVSMLVHLSPAWAYATVGFNSLQVPPGPGPVWDQGSTMHWSPEGVVGLSGGWGGSVLFVMGVTSSLGTLSREGRVRGRVETNLQSKSSISGRIWGPIWQVKNLRPRKGVAKMPHALTLKGAAEVPVPRLC